MEATFDFAAGSCSLAAGSVDRGVQVLEIGFRRNGQLPVMFTDLRFGWTLLRDGPTRPGSGEQSGSGVAEQQANYPESPDIRYVAAYEEVSQRDIILVDPETAYTLTVWAEDAGTLLTASESFVSGPPLSMEEAMQKVEPLDVEI